MTAYTWGLQFVCGSFFFVAWPLMVLWDEIGFCGKTIFQAPIFFAHAWTASNPRKINMWVDLGTWNIAFPNNLKKTEALRKNQNKNLKIRDLREPGPQAFGFLTRAVLITKIIVYLYTYIYIILYYIILYCIILYYILYFTLFYYIILYYIILYYIILYYIIVYHIILYHIILYYIILYYIYRYSWLIYVFYDY